MDNLAAAGIERPKASDGTPVPIPNTADSGYFSAEAVEKLMGMGFDPHIATGRQKHHDVSVPVVEGEPSAAASVKEKMMHRKHIVEPVFGQIKSARGIRKFLLRGLEKVSGEWQLICLTHNLLKIWRCGDCSGAS